jgi:hypothetical protein
MQQCIKICIIPSLYEAQHVSGDTLPIIRSLKLHKQPLVLHMWEVVGSVHYQQRCILLGFFTVRIYTGSLIKTYFLFILRTPRTLTRTVSILRIYKVNKRISVSDREERLPGFPVPLPGRPFQPHRNFLRIIMFIHNLRITSGSSLYIF